MVIESVDCNRIWFFVTDAECGPQYAFVGASKMALSERRFGPINFGNPRERVFGYVKNGSIKKFLSHRTKKNCLILEGSFDIDIDIVVQKNIFKIVIQL